MYRDEEGLVYYDAGMMELDLRELLNLFWRRKWFIVTLVFIALLLSYFITDRMPRIYETSTLIMIKESGVDSLFSGQFSLLGASKNKSASYKALMESRMVLDKVIAELGLRDDKGELLPAKALREHISISSTADTGLSTADTGLIRITVQYPEPVLARDIANKVVEVFTRENQRINNADLNSAIDFVNRQLATVQEELTKLEGELLQYKEESGLIMPSEYGATLLRRLTELESRKAEAELALREARIVLNESRKYLAEEEESIVSSQTISRNPIVSANKERLIGLEIELAGLMGIYTEKHPRVQEVKEKIAEVEKVLADNVEEIISSRTETLNPIHRALKERIIQLETTVISTEARISALAEGIREQEEKLKELPARELDLVRLERETRIAENIYLILMERREELQIQEAMQTSDLVVIDPAIVNEVPVKPRKFFNMAIAVILAGMLAVFIIFLQEYLDTTVKEEKDIGRLTGLTVLGIIPDIKKKEYRQGYGVDQHG